MATKTRAFVSIGYPESLKDDWIDILSETHVQVLISPLHNEDISSDGSKKKEHYHILILFDGPKTIEQAQTIFDSIGATKCQMVNSVRGQARYLCHLDDLDKAPYDVGSVTALNGADYLSLIELPSNKYQIIRDIITYCKEENIYSFAELFEYAAASKEDWFRCLCDNGAYVIEKYLKSRFWTYERDE